MDPIPIDIVEAIIEKIGNEDIRTLKACALTHSTFLRPSQRRLFHSITIFCASNVEALRVSAPAKLNKLHNAITTGLHLSAYVEEFTLFDWYRRDICDLPALPTVLNLLKNVKSFTFTTMVNEWASLSPALKQALVSTLSLPSLKKVRLGGIPCIPIGVAMCLRRIQTVTIAHHSCRFSAVEDSDISALLQDLPTSSSSSYLRNFSVVRLLSPEDKAGFRLLADSFSSPYCKLEKVTMNMFIDPLNVMEIITGLAVKHKNTLITLEIPSGIKYEEAHLSVFDIGVFPELKSIRLDGEISNSDPFRSATIILENAHPNNNLREICFDCTTITRSRLKNLSSEWTFATRLDSMLSGSRFPVLEKVIFSVCFRLLRDNEAKEIVEVALKYFSKIHEKGIMVVDKDDYTRVKDKFDYDTSRLMQSYINHN